MMMAAHKNLSKAVRRDRLDLVESITRNYHCLENLVPGQIGNLA